MSYLVYILLGTAPSLIWLGFYLRKDAHPEPKKTILKIFFLGVGSAVFAALIQGLIKSLTKQWLLTTPLISNSFKISIQIIYISWGVALIEELSKYIAVEKKYVILKNGALDDPDCDEPLDIMLYMIISALGFAALENILKLYSENLPLAETLLITSLRFIGATFLHALCSGAFGFFLALARLNHKKRFYFFTAGLTIAVLLHGIFNYSIIKIGQSLMFIDGSTYIANCRLFTLGLTTLIFSLTGLAIFVSLGLRKLKKLKAFVK